MLHRYVYCRSELECEFELSELPPSARRSDDSFRIVVDPVTTRSVDRWLHRWTSGSGWALAVGLAGSNYVIRSGGADSYLYNAGSKTLMLPSEPSSVGHNDLLNQVLPRVLDHEGRFLMHGSAVHAGEVALSFVGASGRGKSTLGSALDANGARLLSDDCMEFFIDGAAAICRPTYRSLRLWKDSADALPPTDAYKRIEGDEQKLRFHAIADGGPAPDLPLAAIYMLADPDEAVDDVVFGPVAPAVAVAALLKNCFRLDPTDAARARSTLDTAADVVQRVPVFTLAYPREYDRLGEVTQTILEHAELIGSRKSGES